MNEVEFQFIHNPDEGCHQAVPVKKVIENKKKVNDRIHNLKILLKYYVDVHNGKKKAEVRKNDRGFTEGDLIQFSVLNKDYEVIDQPIQKYIITHVLNFEQGLNEGYVVLSIDKYKE